MWDKFLKFLSDNKDALNLLFGSGILVVMLGGIYKIAAWLIKEFRARNLRSNDNFPFRIINPNNNLFKEILGGEDNDPFADRNIPYQQRLLSRSIKDEIDNILKDNRWVIVTGRTGLGKTREIINVAQHLNNNGWTILYLTRDKWLEAPSLLPKGVPDKKLLFILDDLNRKMYASRVEQSPKGNNTLQPLVIPLQKRLLETLKTYEALCGKSEVYVLATARDEKVSIFENEPSEWGKLETEKYPELWKSFSVYNLPIPENDTIAKLIKEISNEIKIETIDEDAIARINDGTFLNIIENMRFAYQNRTSLVKENFRNTLKGTWEKRYRDNIKTFETGIYIYDAVDLLRLRGFKLTQEVIAKVAKSIIKNSLAYVARFRYYFLVNKEIKKLIQLENLTQPRDGQIEAKGYRTDEGPYLMLLSKVAVEQGSYIDIMPFPLKVLFKIIFSVIFGIMTFLYLIPSKDGKHPIEAFYYYAIGIYHYRFERYTEALEFLSLAVKSNSDLRPTNFIFKKRIAQILTRQGRYKEAIYAFRKLNIDRNFGALYDMGLAYLMIGDFSNAIITLEKGVEIAPLHPLMKFSLAEAYIKNKKYEKAKRLLLRMTRRFPKSPRTYSLLAICLRKLGEKENFETTLTKANKLVKNGNEYARSCIEALYGNTDKSIELLKIALQKNHVSMDIIRNDPHFDTLKQKDLFKSLFINK